MLLGNLQAFDVYQVNNTNFQRIGNVDDLVSVKWQKYFNKYVEVVIKANPTEHNISLLKKGNILCPNSKNAAIIDVVEIEQNGSTFSLVVKGLTLESLLRMRVHGDYYWNSVDAPELVTILVRSNFVLPNVSALRVPYFYYSEDIPEIGEVYSQKILAKNNVYDTIKKFADITDTMGFEVQFIPSEQKILFQVLQGVDHTIASDYPVIFSDEFENIISLDFYTSKRDYKNLAYVAGEGEGTNRKVVIVGDASLTGYDRIEHFVDARDLQSGDDSGSTMTEEEYRELLRQRGREKLSELQEIKTVSGKLNVNNTVFTYGVDYNLGDKVTVINEAMGVQVDAQIYGVEESISNTYEASLIVGYGVPTLSEKLKNIYG